MRKDLAVGAASGYSFDELRYWLNSLEHTGFSGDRVVLIGRNDDTLIGRCRDAGCRVATRRELLGPAAAGAPFRDADMSVARHDLLSRFLETVATEPIRYVIAVDMRDAIFQTDPSVWLATHLGEKSLVVSSEGLTYADEPWNRRNLLDVAGPRVMGDVVHRQVWNGGTIAGEATAMLGLAKAVHDEAGTITYGDQAALNIVVSQPPYSRTTLFDTGEVGWACQAATMTRWARAAELAYAFRGTEPLFDGDRVYTSSGRPFCVVHQYDRIPSWKAYFHKRFG